MDDQHDCDDCRQVFEKLSEYIDQELDKDECLILEERIKNCKPCLEFLESLNYTIKLCRATGSHEAYRIPRDVSVKLHDFLKKECKVP